MYAIYHVKCFTEIEIADLKVFDPKLCTALQCVKLIHGRTYGQTDKKTDRENYRNYFTATNVGYDY